MVTAPVTPPTSDGANFTLIMQLLPGLNDPGQLLVWAKLPLVAIEESATAPVALSFRDVTITALGVPTTWLLNVMLDGDGVSS